jgi:hypothetical protein
MAGAPLARHYGVAVNADPGAPVNAVRSRSLLAPADKLSWLVYVPVGSGTSYQVADNAEPHRSRTRAGATLFIVD